MFYSWRLYCKTHWRWSHEWPKHAVLTLKDICNNFTNVHCVGLHMDDIYTWFVRLTNFAVDTVSLNNHYSACYLPKYSWRSQVPAPRPSTWPEPWVRLWVQPTEAAHVENKICSARCSGSAFEQPWAGKDHRERRTVSGQSSGWLLVSALPPLYFLHYYYYYYYYCCYCYCRYCCCQCCCCCCCCFAVCDLNANDPSSCLSDLLKVIFI